MSKVLVVAGTADAMLVIDELLNQQHEVSIAITNRMSMSSLEKEEDLDIHQGKINKQNFTELTDKIKPDYIVDASNPYSAEITKNVMVVSEEKEIPYIRYLREQPKFNDPDVIKVASHREVCEYLNQVEGKILLTVGSNKIENYTCISDYRDRVCLRILPDSKVIAKCEKIGFNKRNIVAMRGPFNEALNREIFKFLDVKFLVTKESGNVESVMEKIETAKSLGMKIVLIERRDVIASNQTALIAEVVNFVQ